MWIRYVLKISSLIHYYFYLMLNFFWKLVVLIYNFIYQMHRPLYGYHATSCLSKVGHITVRVRMKLGMHDCLQVTDCTQ